MQLVPHIKYSFKTNCSVDEAIKLLKDNIGTYNEYFGNWSSCKEYFGSLNGNSFEICRRLMKNQTPYVCGRFIKTIDGCEIDIQIKPDKIFKLIGYLFYLALIGFGVYKIIQFPEDTITYLLFFPSVILLTGLTWYSIYQIEKRKSKEFLEELFS